MRKALAIISILGVLSSAMFFGEAIAYTLEEPEVVPIYIKADGSIEPSTAPIQHTESIYTLTDNIKNHNITIQCNNIILDGAGFNLQGPGREKYNIAAVNMACTNVTVFNFHIFDWNIGVLGTYDNNTIQSNIFSNNIHDVAVYANNYMITGNHIGPERIVGNNITVSQNQIALGAYECGFWITNCTALKIVSNNITFDKQTTFFVSTQNSGFQVYHNNFLNIEEFSIGILVYPRHASSYWDNGVEGNYWSDYADRYPSAREIGTSGVGDIQYVSGSPSEVIDRYPLIKPYNYSMPQPPVIAELNWMVLPLLFTIMVFFALVVKTKTLKKP
jgi:hypothetical protein